MIKKLLLLIVAVVAIAGLSKAAVAHYDQYKNKNLAQAKVVALKQANEVTQAVNAVQKQADQKYSQLSQAYTSLQAECQKGVNAYDTLSPAIRAKLPAPNCQEE